MPATITPRRSAVKGPPLPDGSGSQSRTERPRRGPPAGKAGALGADEDLEPARPPAALILATRRLKSSGGAETGPTLCDFDPDGEDRRTVPRHEAIVLTARERAHLRTMLARASQCEARYIELRRAKPRPDGVVEERALMPAPCHVRICPTCDQRRRDREAVRLEGRWRVFFTMGMPSGVRTAARAWRKVSEWIGQFFQELRRAVRDGDAAAGIRIPRSEHRRITKANAARAGGRAAPVLQYGWCVEPHKSGYPHVHFVTNARFISRHWVLATWSRIIRARCQWNHVDRLKRPGGICRYLAKYQSKTVFTLEISAILYRRRTWASTVPAAPVAPLGWERVQPTAGESLAGQVDGAALWARASGWDVTSTGDGSYATFSRFFTLPEWKEYEAAIDRSLGRSDPVPAYRDREYEYFQDFARYWRTPREERAWPERPAWTLGDGAPTAPPAGGGAPGMTVEEIWAVDAALLTLATSLW